MVRTTTSLTNTQIDKAKAKDKKYNLADCKGLILRVKPNGSKLRLFNKIFFILLMVSSLSVNAVPIVWNVKSNILNGSFTYDSDNITYSNMYLEAIHYQPDSRSMYEVFTTEDSYCCVRFSGYDWGFYAFDLGYDAELEIKFGPPHLNNLGGETTFNALISDFLNGHSYYFTGTAVSAAVPEPSSIIVLSLGLLFLGLFSKKKNKGCVECRYHRCYMGISIYSV